ncbi:NAD(P)-dependent oxidoreductase [Kineosporia rhizophila]|uniref:NAD-dependent epimerase/dehydratase family protein n=1 Tax=Kineosporia rhizophila TaxID=84633 RepID=UPI001E3C6B0C|nr:NAD(P)-dependent oxidoreductase [Kineosporia rhizophila]MCE0536214.1 NAD(P)-dependent oxidoreductase [Kineosporia rhizophila]
MNETPGMNVFLTGGSGFVGQHLITRLVGDGHTVWALARSDQAAQKVERAGARPVRGDLADLADLADPADLADLADLAGLADLADLNGSGSQPAWLNSLQESDVVVHAAARMAFWGEDAGFERDNHRPTLALFRAAAAAGVRRFVLISAAAVSTDRNRGPAVVAEDTPTGDSVIAYGRVKLATEQALTETATPGMELIILRPPFIWGTGMTTLDETVASGRFAFIDNGRHTMDFVHVANLAAATAAALTQGRDRGVYYITHGTPMAMRDFFTPVMGALGADVSKAPSLPFAVATLLGRVLDRTARMLRRPTPPPLYNWLVAIMGRDRSYDITRARTELGYRPEVTFAAGVKEMRAAAGPRE